MRSHIRVGGINRSGAGTTYGRPRPILLAVVLTLLASSFVLIGSSAPAAAALDWVAYNDLNTTAGAANPTNVTSHTYATTDGILRNYDTGLTLPVTVTGSTVGGYDPQVNGGPVTNASSDAYAAFNGIVDLSGTDELDAADWDSVLTFSGLDDTMRYAVTLSANRNNNAYAGERFARVTIDGVDAATAASSAGVVVNSPTSVSFSVGQNATNGYMAKWVSIDPGADGMFTVTSEWDDTQGSQPPGTGENTKGYAMSAFKLEAYSDTTAPVITLLGDAVVQVEVGEPYSDAGATASDDFDGDITGDIVVVGDVIDTSSVGDHTVTYNVEDAAGNPAVEVTRTVNVVNETTKPGAPVIAVSVAPTGTALNVSWADVNYETSYQVWSAMTAAGPFTKVGSALPANSTSASVPNTPGYPLCVRVDASSAVGTSMSNVECAPSGDSYGLVDPGSGVWTITDVEGDSKSFYFGDPGDVPFLGDWDCDDVDTPGLYRQSDGYVYLRNSNTQGIADISYYFGNPGDVPLAGDFNGDGCDTVSIYRPSEARFYVINKLGSGDGGLGSADTSFLFGDSGDTPFAGDFDGDGLDTFGLYRTTSGLMYYRNSLTTGIADYQFYYGDPGDRFVSGDWNANGSSSPGVFRSSNKTMYLKYFNTQGNADRQVAWPDITAAALPVAGVVGDLP